MIVRFEYWLHDTYQSDERIAAIARSAGITIDDDLADKIGRPFHEVFLSCTLDVETGAVTVESVQV